MPLWNTTDANTGAPKFAIYGGLGVAANGNVLFANTQTDAFLANAAIGCNGITAVEKTSVSGPAHAGWVAEKRGTGPIASISITNGGAGYTGGNGYLTITGGGTGNLLANVAYTVNAANSIVAVTINSPGAKYKTTPTVNTVATYSTQATFSVVMGGRANRVEYETLVATGNIA